MFKNEYEKIGQKHFFHACPVFYLYTCFHARGDQTK